MLESAKLHENFVQVARKRIEEMIRDTDKAIAQMEDNALFWTPNEHSNSVAIIIKHLSGNLISRWTDFLTTDGEKHDRDRDGEFENTIKSREELLRVWETGCKLFLQAIDSIEEQHLLQTIYIRNEPHTVMEAVFRSITHFTYHVGQIVFIAKQLTPENEWATLSIPKKKK
ncbi:DinB family protein [Psychrobacillus vulpis]|uniref:DinB family protein n=1 Tax=Psychrobacillus vulpis TaxID=2325572 RepID=UPI001F111B3A|nr:DinB family protein [Psychrobacillus vulpis]